MEYFSRGIALILLFLLTPLIILISVFCYFFQGRPLFFRQIRIGYKYKPFKQNNKQKLIILNNLFNHYKELVFNRLIIKMPMIDTNLEKLITRLDHLNINNYGVAFCMWSHNIYKILKV